MKQEFIETANTKLQWGHVFSDVEITAGATGIVDNDTLQWGHVFSDVEIF